MGFYAEKGNLCLFQMQHDSMSRMCAQKSSKTGWRSPNGQYFWFPVRSKKYHRNPPPKGPIQLVKQNKLPSSNREAIIHGSSQIRKDKKAKPKHFVKWLFSVPANAPCIARRCAARKQFTTKFPQDWVLRAIDNTLAWFDQIIKWNLNMQKIYWFGEEKDIVWLSRENTNLIGIISLKRIWKSQNIGGIGPISSLKQ